MRTLLLAGLTSLLLGPVSTDAQVTGYLTAYIEDNFSDFSYATDFMQGSLNQGERQGWDVWLDEGYYSAIAACDDDCTDLDMNVGDPGGVGLGLNIAADAFPFVEFHAPSGGEYAISVTMVACSVEPCYYAIRVIR